jgi:hypothetical protein
MVMLMPTYHVRNKQRRGTVPRKIINNFSLLMLFFFLRINGYTQIKSKKQGIFFGYTLDNAFLLVFCKVSVGLKINFWFITSSNLVFRMVTHVNIYLQN